MITHLKDTHIITHIAYVLRQTMFCCFLPSRRLRNNTQNDEKNPLVTSGTFTFNYQTILTIPYAHVIRDDKIQIESSKTVKTNAPNAYLLVDSTISDKEYETACFSFDDTDVSTPVVIATRTTDGHILFERLFQIEHVTAINSSGAIRMHQINQTKTISSSTVSMARPFDEFSTDSTMPNDSLDVQSNTTTKTD